MQGSKPAYRRFTLFFTSLVFLSLFFVPQSVYAAGVLLWGDFDNDDYVTIADGDTQAVALNVVREAEIIPQSPGVFAAEGVLFFVPDPNSSTREFVASINPFFGASFAWLEAGVYELDIYAVDPGPSPVQIPRWKQWFTWVLPKEARAQNPEDFLGTIRFTILDENAPPVQECCSSVLFLPGVQGSRLYENGERLWEPLSESEVQALYLNESGDSVNANIYTQDVIDEVPISGGNIYKSFLDDLAQKQSEGTIANYEAVPYDWRLALPDILASGKEEADGSIFYNRVTSTPYIEQTLRKLATDSQTEKVTIVAHSNGGLLAKALLNQLGSEAGGLVDQIIMVGVPQIGTPQAVGALLHGYEMGLPFNWLPLILTPERARDFARNAPAVYQLLPHADYYNNAGLTITTPLVSFEGGVSTQQFIDAYGTIIDDGNELHNFLTALEGREPTAFSDLENPAIANEDLLIAAEVLVSTIGSSWQPPTGVKVHQIAGIGEDTLAGITYQTIQECVRRLPFSTIPVCLEYEPKLSYSPEEVIDGDGTVVVSSALAMSDVVEGVERWWVNLQDYNRVNPTPIPLPSPFRTNHKDLLEVDELRNFVFNNLLTKASTTLPRYISETQPNIIGGNRLRFILHSPLALSATDSEGSEISETASTIPGAVYKRYGEVQVITVPTDTSPTVVLEGVSDGSFTLEVEEYSGNTLVEHTTFSGVPSLSNTSASMSLPDGTVQNAGDLEIDYDGNGTVDFTLEPEVGETVNFPDPSLTTLLTILKETIQNLEITDKLKKKILKKVVKLEKKIDKKKKKSQKILPKLQKKIDKEVMKGKIDSGDAETILLLLEELETQSDELTFDEDILIQLKEATIALDAKEKFKSNLLKRVERLENKQKLINTLSRLEARIIRKGEKGKIDNKSVQELLELLEEIEEVI